MKFHLAELVGLLGNPPSDFIKRCMRRFEFFDDEGEYANKFE